MRRHVGKVVKRQRLELDMSQSELAVKIGTGQSYVSRLESSMHMPGYGMLLRLAKALRLEVGDFF